MPTPGSTVSETVSKSTGRVKHGYPQLAWIVLAPQRERDFLPLSELLRLVRFRPAPPILTVFAARILEVPGSQRAAKWTPPLLLREHSG
jgi:hypothetical protein